MVHQFRTKLLRNLGRERCLHMKPSVCPLKPRLLLERLHSIWSILVTLKKFLKKLCTCMGLPPFKVLHNTGPYLLKLCKIFANSNFYPAGKDPDVWITSLQALRERIDEIGLVTRISDMVLMIHVLNNLPEEYDVLMDSLENRLVLTGEDILALESLREK